MSATDWLLVINTVVIASALAIALYLLSQKSQAQTEKNEEFQAKLLQELGALNKSISGRWTFTNPVNTKTYDEAAKEFMFLSKRMRAASIDIQGFIHLASRYLVWAMPDELTKDMGKPPWEKEDPHS